MIGSRVLGLQMVFTNYPLIYVLLKYFRLWITEKPNKTNLGAETAPRRIQALVQAPLLGRFGQHRSQLAFRTLESGDLVHAIIADLSGRTSIEGHHRYPSGKKATHPANIILARLKQSIDPDFLSYLTCPSYFDHS